MLTEYDIEIDENNGKTSIGFMLKNFKGPVGTPYEGGVFAISVLLPPEYPFKSPSIGFRTRIFHPNIDERSGTVCLDVINQTWSPMYDLKNVFDVFLPQLLTYGNAADPLNGEAAALMLRDPEKFKQKVKQYILQYATPSITNNGVSSSFSSSSSSSAPSTSVPIPATNQEGSSVSSSSSTNTMQSSHSVPLDENESSAHFGSVLHPPDTATTSTTVTNELSHEHSKDDQLNDEDAVTDHHTSKSSNSSIASDLSELSDL